MSKRSTGSLPSRAEVLELIGSEDRAMHAREIAAKLEVRERDYLALQRILDDLGYEGLVALRPGQKYTLPRETKRQGSHALIEAPTERPLRRALEEREGVLSVNARGFGFVATAESPGDDVFVPGESLGGALHGDRVVVRIVGRSSRGVEGAIARVVERGRQRVGGVLRRRGGSAWVEPDDARLRGPIVLTHEVDRRGPEGNSGSDGDAVIVAITRYPESPDENPEGKLEAVLGRPGELRVEAAKILLLERIEELHSEAAVREAEAFGDEVPAALREAREDLRHLPLPTIDPEDARDHDDAVWVERTERGGYRAYIAIADVSTYVTPGSKLDEEALARGCSVYLPDHAVPMLPRALSSNLCSLLPGVDRLCLCVIAEVGPGGSVEDARLVRGIMRSQAKLHYGGVARALGFSDAPSPQPEAERLRDGLQVAYELSRLLRGKRMKRGALDFELPEAKVVLNESGEPVDIVRRSQDPGVKRAYQLIEELMLLANEVVARWLQGKSLPAIFRVHAPPDETKLERFGAMCETLGISFDPEATQDPKLLSGLLKSFADHPLAQVLNVLLLRSMKQATYDVANVGHFGLASKAYLHFTSPIRRYPDVVAHRLVHKVLLGERVDKDPAAIEKLAGAALASSVAERKAMEVERATVDLYRAYLMKDRIGETFEGTVTSVVGSGAFVALDAPFVDVLVRLEDLGEDSYAIDDDGLKIVGERSGDTIALGDRVTVTIVDVAIQRRSVYGRRRAEPTRASRRGGAKGRADGPQRAIKGERPRKGSVRGKELPKKGASSPGKRPGKKKGRGR